MPEPLDVATVVAALQHLQADTRDEAKKLLAMYARRDELTPQQQRQIIEHFPDRRA